MYHLEDPYQVTEKKTHTYTHTINNQVYFLKNNQKSTRKNTVLAKLLEICKKGNELSAISSSADSNLRYADTERACPTPLAYGSKLSESGVSTCLLSSAYRIANRLVYISNVQQNEPTQFQENLDFEHVLFFVFNYLSFD